MMQETIKKDVGKRLRHIRESSGHTREDFAEIMGISASTVQKIESGRSVPPIPSLWALSQMGISINWIIAGNKNEFPEKFLKLKQSTSQSKDQD